MKIQKNRMVLKSHNQMKRKNLMKRRRTRRNLLKRKKQHNQIRKNRHQLLKKKLLRLMAMHLNLKDRNRTRQKKDKSKIRRKIFCQDKNIRHLMTKMEVWHFTKVFMRRIQNQIWLDDTVYNTGFLSLKKHQNYQRSYLKLRNDYVQMNNQFYTILLIGIQKRIIKYIGCNRFSSKFINEYMTSRRHKTQIIEQDNNQRIPKNNSIENHHFFQHRKKYKLSNANLQSLHSIDTKRSSINLYQNMKLKYPQRRRQLSIPINESKHILTERPEIHEIASKKYSQIRCIPTMRQERLNTIEDERLEDKEKRIKNCIQVMCGVLQEIRNQKSTHKISKSKIVDEFNNNGHENSKNLRENSEGKFQNYIKSITKLKEANKIILIKRGKSKSIINNQNIASSNINSKSFVIKEKLTPMIQGSQIPIKKQTIEPPPPKESKKSFPELKLEEIQCSSIEKGNQSSFVSQFSRNSFMKNILEDNLKDIVIAQNREVQGRKMAKFKNSKQLKQLFPVDFF